MPGTPTDLARFARIRIRREHDLLLHLPLRYEDLTRVVPIGSINLVLIGYPPASLR